MAGKIKEMIDKIIATRSNGNAAIAKITKTKLVLKGINPDSYTADSPDDPRVISGLIQVAGELGVLLQQEYKDFNRSIATGYTNHNHVMGAVYELQDQLSAVIPKLVIYFASPKYEPQVLAEAMKDSFPESSVFGCTTAGEIVSGKMLEGSIVAMAFNAEFIEDIAVEIVQNIRVSSNVYGALSAFENYYQTPMQYMDPQKYIGMILLDGLSLAEESVMEKLGDCTDVTFIGGSAGDDLKFSKTYVYANGKAYTDAAVLALIKPACRFDVIKTQSFKSIGKKLVATKVDESTRTVFQFNGKLAANAYAEAIGQNTARLPEYFIKHPLGLMAEGEPFVRSPQQVRGDSVVFFCNVKEGMELEVLEATQIVTQTLEAVKNKEREMGQLKALINFNCILRTNQLKSQGKTDEYSDIFAKIPTIGFNTYGEAYIGHINQTATMLVFA